jgi:hypothetical protein
MLVGATAVAQTTDPAFEAFKHQREAELSLFKTEYNKGLDSLRDAQNRDFTLLLAGRWIEREVAETPPVMEKPKPDVPPSVTEEKPIVKPTAPIDLTGIAVNPVVEEAPVDVPQDLAPKVQPDELSTDVPAREDTYRAELERALQGASIAPSMFYGNHTWLPVFAEPWPICERPLVSSTIAAFWGKCSTQSADAYLAYLSVQRQMLQLSDWGMLSLVDQWSKQEFSDETDASLFKWYMLVQMGYDVRLMYNKAGASLAYPFRQMFYGQSYLEMNGKMYFMLDDKQEGSFYTYDGSHAGANQLFTLKQNPASLFPEESYNRRIEFSFEGQRYSIDMPYNRNRAKYYASIPQTELGFYFTDGGANTFASSCNEHLRKAVDAFSTQRQQIRFLYALVCSGIPYATDQEQFGYEKFCLPEESLGYAKADCEDRTFLLNYLVRTFTSAANIGLNYPGHVAMAVALDDVHPEDARFKYKNRTYVYCDPTYIGADVGMMPGVYAGQSPEVFE